MIAGRPLPRPVKHRSACGLRVPSPHADCQAWAAPYLAGELRRSTMTSGARVTVLWVDCHVCGVTVQRSESAA